MRVIPLRFALALWALWSVMDIIDCCFTHIFRDNSPDIVGDKIFWMFAILVCAYFTGGRKIGVDQSLLIRLTPNVTKS